MINKIIILASIIASLILGLMINLTTPITVGPLGVLIFVLLVYLVCFGLVTMLFKIFWLIYKPKKVMSRKNYYYIATLSLAPILMLIFKGHEFYSLIIAGFLTLGLEFGLCLLLKKFF